MVTPHHSEGPFENGFGLGLRIGLGLRFALVSGLVLEIGNNPHYGGPKQFQL